VPAAISGETTIAGDTDAVLVEVEIVHVVAVIRIVAGRGGRAGGDAVVRAAMFVVGDDEEAQTI
jgi:hypothetical protein